MFVLSDGLDLNGARAKPRKRNHKKERQPASYSFFPDGWLSFFLVVSFSWSRAQVKVKPVTDS